MLEKYGLEDSDIPNAVWGVAAGLFFAVLIGSDPTPFAVLVLVIGSAAAGVAIARRRAAALAEEASDTASVAGGMTAPPKPAPSGGADDLKRIKGVGPALETKLNDLGITNYAQIAGWSPEDVTRVDDALNFKGRIDRDGWIDQARSLMAGGDGNSSESGDEAAG